MPLAITPLYTIPLVLLFIALSGRVILYRRRNKIPLGDAGDQDLLSLVRAQANCAEYMPLGVLLLLIAELADGASQGLHFVGISLLVGRYTHALHLSYFRSKYILRIVAIALTFAAYLCAVALAWN